MPQLVMTSRSKIDNTKKWVRMLEIHGYVRKIGPSGNGYAGQYQNFILAKEQPLYPLVCERCGSKISAKKCEPEAVTPGSQTHTQPLKAADPKKGGIR